MFRRTCKQFFREGEFVIFSFYFFCSLFFHLSIICLFFFLISVFLTEKYHLNLGKKLREKEKEKEKERKRKRNITVTKQKKVERGV